MAISGSDPVNDLNQTLFGIHRSKQEETRVPTASSPSIPRGDRVVFSQEIQEREALVNKIRALPDIRVDQVSSVQQALLGGRLQVDGERLAAGVIRETVLNAVA